MAANYIFFSNPYATDPATYGLTRTQTASGLTRYADSQGNYYIPQSNGFQLDTSIPAGSIGYGSTTPSPGQQTQVGTSAPAPLAQSPSASAPVAQTSGGPITSSIPADGIVNIPGLGPSMVQGGVVMIKPSDSSPWVPAPQDRQDKYQAYINSQQQQQQPAAPTASNSSQTAGSTGNQVLDATLQSLQKYLDQILSSGNTVNPALQITPETVQKFLDQATSQIDPYYAGQISAIKNELGISVQTLQKSYDIEKQQTEAAFKKELSTTREQTAGAGIAFSGIRGQMEQDIGSAQNLALQGRSLGLESDIGKALRTTERQIGSRDIQSIYDTLPTFPQYGASTAGEGSLSSARNLSFAPLGGTTGSLEFERTAAIDQRKGQLLDEEIKRKLYG